MSDNVPEGTIDDVLTWVGDDRRRAQLALDVETSEPDSERSTLVTKLEAIVASGEEAPMTDTKAPEAEVETAVNLDVLIDLSDVGAVVQPAVARDPDVVVPEEDTLVAHVNADPCEPSDDHVIDGEQTEFLQVASTSNAVAVALNGEVFLLTAQMAVALKVAVGKAVAGLTL
jgi:hypothetical protein